MSRNAIIAGVAVVLVLGVGAWSLTRNNSESTDDTNSSQNGEVTTTGESSMAVFGPKAMNNTDYVATFKVTGSNGHSGTGVYEHSANGDYKISGSSQGQTYEVYFIGSAMISCGDGECIKMPSNMSNAPVDVSSIGYNDSSADAPENDVKHTGTASCAVGTCDAWEVTGLSKNGKITYHTKGDRVYRMIVESDDGVMDGSYEYKDVTIKAPANVISL